MPTIGWFEILIVVAIAIIVLGPKDFPIMLKKAGSWIGTAVPIQDPAFFNMIGKSLGPSTIIAIATTIKISNQPIVGM